MPTQNIWIAITVGVFGVGFFIGGSIFGIFSSQTIPESPPPITSMMPGPQMMQDQEFRTQMMNEMTQDEEFMARWMSSSEHAQQMTAIMSQDHEFGMMMLSNMMDDPNLRTQMLGHLYDNPQTLDQMKKMMQSLENGTMSSGQTGMIGTGNHGMGSDSGMMMKEMMQSLLDNPETRQKTLEYMKRHISEMNRILSGELTHDQMIQHLSDEMKKHMEEMQSLMNSTNHMMH